MPELPEVETVVRTLRPLIVGQTLRNVALARADIVSPVGFDLVGRLSDRTVAAIDRRAKRIVFTLDDASRFYVHLGMTGQLTVDAIDQPAKKHTHLAIDLPGERQLRFVDPRRFGGVFWLDDATDAIGPEPLAMRATTLARQLATTRRAIKVALLDQRVVAGIGNIYADEALHAAGIHPLTPADQLGADDVRRLTLAIKRVLRRAIEAGGSSLRDYVDGEGRRGSFQNRHRVYDRAGEPCRRCKAAIIRIVLGGRSTCFCATCQPEAAATRQD